MSHSCHNARMSHSVTTLNNHLKRLRKLEETITPIRRAILVVLNEASQPLTARQILEKICQQGVSAHRATVYRDIDLCLRAEIVNAYSFKNHAVLHYEIVTDHHHHLICEVCGLVKLVHPDEAEKGIELFEARVKNNLDFKIESHRLKFYGTCHNCDVKRKEHLDA